MGQRSDFILNALQTEMSGFQTIQTGEKELKIIANLPAGSLIDGNLAFVCMMPMVPLEMTVELATENGFEADKNGFEEAFKAHQALSRAGSEQKFKGGLADHSVETTQLHTAIPLLPSS